MAERTFYWLAGVVCRLTGLGFAANLSIVGAHVLAALSFYLACRLWRVAWPIAWLLALPYAFTPYILVRSLPHFGLTFCGLLPLQLYSCWYLATARHLTGRSGRFRLSVAVALVSGILNIYYVLPSFCSCALLPCFAGSLLADVLCWP